MRANEFGTNPKRPQREGSRPSRGHEPLPRYTNEQQSVEETARMSAAVKLQRAFDRERSKSDASRQRADAAKAEFEREWKAKQEKEKQGVAEGSLNEFAPDGFNGDDDEGFSPEIAKMAQEDGFTKGASLADGATLERAMSINHWHNQHGGMYKQYFAKGFKQGRMNKIRHDNKQYNLNLKLMKDGSIRHGEQGVAEAIAQMETELEALAEEGKASRKLCASSKPDSELGASQLASCKSQGLRSRDGNKSHKLGKSPKSRVKVGGHKIKGQKYGGPLPDWS